MSGPAARRAAGDSLLRISQACETLVAGFNSGQAAAARSCLASRDRAMSIGELESPDLLPPLETAMAQRRTRPSLLLPAWRAVGFAVGTSAAALLPPEASAKVGDTITKTVSEQYDANIRMMYDFSIADEEIEVKDLFKSQRDKRSEAKPSPPSPHDGGDGGSNPADDSAQAAGATISSLDARAMAIEGALKSALRFACDVTSKV